MKNLTLAQAELAVDVWCKRFPEVVKILQKHSAAYRNQNKTRTNAAYFEFKLKTDPMTLIGHRKLLLEVNPI